MGQLEGEKVVENQMKTFIFFILDSNILAHTQYYIYYIIYRVHILKYDAVAHFSTCNVCDANQKGSSENQKTSFSKQISFSKQWKGSSEDVEGLTRMHICF